jgi:acetate kinase
MPILVVNAGSSSLKLDVIDPVKGARLHSATVERIGSEACVGKLDGTTRALAGASHASALESLLPALGEGAPITGVGHRVAHGGPDFHAPVRIDADVLAGIEAISHLAPLHNPPALAGIRAARAALPNVSHVAVFDTAFHGTLPSRAKAYALPQALVAKHGIRRYGFHGPSHAWVAARAATAIGDDLRNLRIITCHLGNGSSVCAVEYGRSVETSMGMTPLEGLVMGTRAGDIDAGVLLMLARAEGLDLDALDALLNKSSGLAGLSGVGNDLRDIEQRASAGDEHCRLAVQVFAHRVRKYIGAYAAVMGGVDAIVFTAGIGENSALMRHRIAQRLEFLGARFDEDKNRDARATHERPVVELSEDGSRVRIFAIATDEAMAIANETAKLVAGRDVAGDAKRIPIAISARHIHLTNAAVEALFGKGHVLTPYKPLSQPGQYACEEKLTVTGPKGKIENVRVLGPVRSECQIEISRTDEFVLGVDAPVRDSGDVANTPGVTLVGPVGSLSLHHGLICARRHIHMHTDDAARFGVKDGDVVEVAVDSQGRDLVFGDVLIRVSPKYALEMHVDTDEANAAELRPGDAGDLALTGGTASIRRRAVTGDTL